MKAVMKLTADIALVALGVTMALASGIVKAQEKNQQNLPGSISAQTTLPSVGHRPKMYKPGNWSLQGGAQMYNSSLLLPVGSRLMAHSHPGPISDADNILGAKEETYERTYSSCRVYRVASDHTETLISDSGDTSCDYSRIYITEHEVGYRIKFASYVRTNPASASGYTPNPTESLEHTFITDQIVSDLYDVRKTTISPMRQTVSNSLGMNVTVTAADFNNRPVTGLDITFVTLSSSENPDDAKLIASKSVDNGDGSYTSFVKSSHPGTFFWVTPVLNGTAGGYDKAMLEFK